jgi:HEAT repeat protein
MWKFGVSALLFLTYSTTTYSQEPLFLGKTAADWQLRLSLGDDQDRHQAAWALSQCGKAADRSLLSMSEHTDPVVRFWMIQGLGRNLANETADAQKQAYLKHLKQALRDKSPAPRIAAADHLARLGALDEALPVLIAALDEPQESAAMQAAAALAALGKQAEPAREKLKVAAEKGGEYVKRLATRALQNLEQ